MRDEIVMNADTGVAQGCVGLKRMIELAEAHSTYAHRGRSEFMETSLKIYTESVIQECENAWRRQTFVTKEKI